MPLSLPPSLTPLFHTHLVPESTSQGQLRPLDTGPSLPAHAFDEVLNSRLRAEG
jgi:hypothetical protein